MPEDHVGQDARTYAERSVRDGLLAQMTDPQMTDPMSSPGSPSIKNPYEPLPSFRTSVSVASRVYERAQQQSAKECSAVLLGMKKERVAKSVWHRNRETMDVPEWFGFPECDEDERELPELFGMSLHPHGDVSGIPELGPVPASASLRGATPASAKGAARASAGQGAQPRQGGAVLSFPMMQKPAAKPVPHRSQETVLRFRAPLARQPILLFSLVGGAGQTSLAAGLTRVLASCRERVMLADAGGHSLLPHYFGGRGSRQGVVRKFVAPPAAGSEPVSMLSLDVESFAWNDEEMDRIFVEFAREASSYDRVVWDLGSAPVEWCARVLRQGARVIVPLLPTAKCLMQLPATEAILQKGRKLGELTNWQYVLNQFDEQDPAHVNIRGRFRGQLGERLLPFVLRSTPLVNEALLCGKTVIDHAPACPLVGDLWRLARAVGGLPQANAEMVPGAWGEG